MNQEAKAYLNEALDILQQHSVHRERIAWPSLRQEVTTLVAHAQTPSETYPAIEMALQRLGDHHSLFLDPERKRWWQQGRAKQTGLRATYPEGIIGLIYPDSPAQRAGLHVGDRIETINGQPLAQLSWEQFRMIFVRSNTPQDLALTITPVGQDISHSLYVPAAPISTFKPPQGQRLEHNIGYLDLPGLLAINREQVQTYAETAQRLIREIDQPATGGWVIDLRRNTGGNMWPMLAGVGPVLGEGTCGYFVASGKKTSICYRGGQAFEEQPDEGVGVNEPYELKHPQPPVAVLTSQLTSSSGEFAALAFRQRPHTRSFGEPTSGVPTGNEIKELSDGAWILLTTCLGADRTGQTYESPLLPDQEVKIDWTRLGTIDDPVLQAAVRWLHTKECCPPLG